MDKTELIKDYKELLGGFYDSNKIVLKFPGVEMSLLSPGARNAALNKYRPNYLLAPLYSIKPTDDEIEFNALHLMHPQFIFMPRSGGIVSLPSLARLDRIFINELASGVSPKNLFVTSEVISICHDQLKQLMGDEPSKQFKETQELLRS